MTCKDCVHYEVCSKKHWHVEFNKYACDLNDIENRCDDFKDKSRIIELPCAMGTTIYMLVTRKTTSFTYNWDKEHISKVMQRHENHHTFIKTTKLMKTNLFSVIDKWNDTVFCNKRRSRSKTKGVERKMIILNFAKWNRKSTSLFVYKRIYKNRVKWTPFVQVQGRYFN